MEFSPKLKLDSEVLEIIERLKKMDPKVPEVKKDTSINLKPLASSTKKPKGSWSSFAESSLPNGDRD